MRQAWAVTDSEDVWALFTSREAAEQYRARYVESEAAGWDDAERPGSPQAVVVLAISLFDEAAEVPGHYSPEWL